MSWLRLKFLTFEPPEAGHRVSGADAFLLETPWSKLTVGLSPFVAAESSYFGFPNVPGAVQRWDHLSLALKTDQGGRLAFDDFEASPEAPHFSFEFRSQWPTDDLIRFGGGAPRALCRPPARARP
jgi:hypothetical protein